MEKLAHLQSILNVRENLELWSEGGMASEPQPQACPFPLSAATPSPRQCLLSPCSCILCFVPSFKSKSGGRYT